MPGSRDGEQVMSTTPQAGTYVVESSAAEYDRLVGLADTFDEHVRDGCRRAGLRSGDRVIDVGCGPLGALLSLGDLVGPTGRWSGWTSMPRRWRRPRRSSPARPDQYPTYPRRHQ